ncbi:polysaccharide biosynthesis tyrosine autokinase [Patulibacter sp. SYSU D01012]|uniref:polysaccharide biosynthesis tyrosine autokinase n=1 Tax=Patulibacter sp. SYSU D01012 TaxID=2817381 RepID=UPI001B30338D|nr:polysaccharide biosynthesis tyrosine autokinase [Patulibacter sp. SYSU D01012]
MTPRDYLRILRRGWAVPLVLCIVGLAAAFAVAESQSKTFTSKTTVFVSAQAGSTANDLLQSSNFAQERVQSYAAVVKSRAVLEPIAEKFRVEGGATALAEHVSATVPANTVLVRIEAADHSARRAALLANAIGRQAESVISSLEMPQRDGRPSVRVSIVEQAQPATAPSSPNVKLYVAAGGILGLLAGWMFLVVREVLDTRVKTNEDLAKVTDLPVLAEMDRVRSNARDRLRAASGHPARQHAEAYRQLRTNLRFADVDTPPKCIAVTSSVPAEGKSTVATNLAVALAEAGARVVLVDADLRRPSVASYLDLEGSNLGITSVLTGELSLDEALTTWSDTTLTVLGAGGCPPNPSELLSSESMERVLLELRERFEYVVIDTPPLLPVADAAIVSTKADGVVFVARFGAVTRPEVERAIGNLSAVGSRVYGIVATHVSRGAIGSGGYYGTYGSYSAETGAINAEGAQSVRSRQ